MRNNITLDLKVECHQISSLSSFVAYGIGVSAIPRHFAKHIDKEHNVLIDLKDEAIHKTVGIVYKRTLKFQIFLLNLLRHWFNINFKIKDCLLV